MKIKQRLIVSLLLTFSATFAMGQDDTQWQRDSLFYSDAPAMEIEEDTTDVQTLDEIINEQMEVNNRLTRDRHFEDVWGRRSYLNISYSSAQLVPQQSYPLGMDNAIVPTYKTNWGLALTIGRSYRLHKPAISNILQFSMDYTFVDFNLNHYDSENGGVNEYDSSKKWKENGTEYYYLPWNLAKYELSYGMAIGPSIMVAPFAGTSSKAAHYLKLNLYYHLGYNISGLLMANDDKADRNNPRTIDSDHENMENNTKIIWGHGITNSIGFSLIWKGIGLGYEHRSATIKYKPLSTDDFGERDYEFKQSLNRVFVQFRM